MRGLNRHEYHAASAHTCVISASSHSFSDSTLKHLRSLAQDAQFLLTTDLPSREMNWFSRQYKSRLIERGLATPTGRVNQRQLRDEFLYFYGHPLLEDSAVSQDDDHSWLTCIVRKHRKVFHPIRHLLMMRFLGISVQEIMKAERPYVPFGTGPWLCLNAAADHYLHPVVNQLAISHCGDTKKPVGTFSCACGFIYCRTGPDETEEDACRIGKIKAVGKVWQQKLRQCVEIEQLGLRATARQLQVDPRTVKCYVERLGLSPRWSSLQSDREVASDVPQSPISYSDTPKLQHREIWKTLQREHPQATKTMLRRQASVTYTWLYRHDRDWLTQNSPPPRRPVPQSRRVDWQQRDQEILTQMQQAVERLLAEEKPVQITMSRVGKAIGHLSLIEQHLDQMPLTQAYLESVVETMEAFQIRRVEWAAEQLDRQGEIALHWKIVRMAGLRPGYSEEVERAIALQLGQTCFTSSIAVINLVV